MPAAINELHICFQDLFKANYYKPFCTLEQLDSSRIVTVNSESHQDYSRTCARKCFRCDLVRLMWYIRYNIFLWFKYTPDIHLNCEIPFPASSPDIENCLRWMQYLFCFLFNCHTIEVIFLVYRKGWDLIYSLFFVNTSS